MSNRRSIWTPNIQPELPAFLSKKIHILPGAQRQMKTIHAPFTGDPIGSVPVCTETDVDDAVEKARRAQAGWKRVSFDERKAIFLRFHDLVLRKQEELLDMIQIECGKARRDALEEVFDVAINARHYSFRSKCYLEPKRRKGVFPLLTKTWEIRSPLGIIGFISPWNYPLTLTISDALPALLAGNAVLLKPDSATPFTALFARELLYDSGLPQDLFQIITGPGSVLGPKIIEAVDYICFTGSTATGRSIACQAAEHLIGCSLELGGKNPMLVLADADLEKSVEGAVRGCFTNAGQLCISFERIYVQERLYESFLEAFAGRTHQIRLGAGIDFQAEMGSLISEEQLSRVKSHVDDAVEKGAKIVAGGRARPDIGPFFYEPTVVVKVNAEMKIAREETFGPVVSVYPFKDLEEAIDLANDSSYGLNASVWSRDIRLARSVAEKLQCGTVNINEAYAATWGSVDAPMGGRKNSGIGRRHGWEGILKYTEAQTISVQHLIPAAPIPGMDARLYARLITFALKMFKGLPGVR